MRLSGAGDIIRPVGPDPSKMPLQVMSIAELLRAAGHFVDVPAEASAREHEVMLETAFLDFPLVKYSAQREPDEACMWTYVVRDPVPVEQAGGLHCRAWSLCCRVA